MRNTTNPIPLFLAIANVVSYHTTNPIGNSIYSSRAELRRRRIVEILANIGQMSATEISKIFDITAQAISQHLKILLDSKLVVMRKHFLFSTVVADYSS